MSRFPYPHRAALLPFVTTLAFGCAFSMSESSPRGSPLERAWQLVGLAAPEARVAEGREATLEFDTGSGQASGFAGCNRFVAAYEVDGHRLSFGRLHSTMMACPDDDASRQEGFFLAALEEVESYELAGAELGLLDADGRLLMTLGPRADMPLLGTTWEAIAVAEGSGGVASVLSGTLLTARFEAGTLTGSGGCNAYRATYRAGEESLTIGPTAATRKLCPEPDGVMEQEAAFFEALSGVAAYSIDGSRLELRTAARKLAVSLRAAEVGEEEP